MVSLQEAPSWVWAVVLLGIFAAIGVLVLSELNSSGSWNSENSTQSAIIDNGTNAIANVTKQMPTVGIIVGVLLIIGAVVVIARYFGRGRLY